MSTSFPECADKMRKIDVKSHPPTLVDIASKFNMPVGDAPATREKVPESTHNLRRLELTGRLELAAANVDTTKQAKHTHSKLGTMPSLNDIRARLNQRGVDITPSAWSPTKQKSISSSQEKASSSTAQNIGLALTEAHKTNVAQDTAKASTPDQTLTNDANSQEHEHVDSSMQNATNPGPSSSSLAGRKAALEAKNGVKHPLQNEWTLYVDMQRAHGTFSGDQYEATLKRVGHFT